MKCSRCNENKNLEEFYKDRSSSRGVTSACKECLSKCSNRKKNEDKHNAKKKEIRKIDPEILNAPKRSKYQKLDPITKVYTQAKSRAKRKGIEFTIEKSDLHVDDLCPILGVPFVVGTKNNYEYTHSLDRIDNSKGYIPGNVQIITKKANTMKNSASLKELSNFATWIRKQMMMYSEHHGDMVK